MANMRLIVAGAGGRMGRTLVKAIAETKGLALAGALEDARSPLLGQDSGVLAGLPANGIALVSDARPLLAKADGIIDFTAPAASVALAALAAGKVHVLGTTGLLPADESKIRAAAQNAVIVKSGNMSLGINMLGRAAAEGRGVDLDKRAVRSRDGHTGARKTGDIGFAVLRGGTVTGEHSVIFAGTAERVELAHKAEDRMIFARGALHAALWARGRTPGLYSMADVLELKDF
jgi:4-hydroxy-tetrahydrodipicolinate reductase